MGDKDIDALVLAVPCDFAEREPQAVVNRILKELHRLLGDTPKRLRDYLDMLETPSANRNLKPYIREAEKMLTKVDVTALPSCELGMEAGQLAERRRLAKGLCGLLAAEVIAEKTGLSIAGVHALQDNTDD